MRWKEYFRSWAGFLIVAVVLLVVILGVTYILSRTDFANNFANALVAWGTLVLAAVAFWSIQKAREENQRLRKESERRHEQDRLHESRRSSLSLLHNWAHEAFNFLEEKHPTNNSNELLNLWKKASTLRLRAIDLQALGLVFDKNFNKKVSNSMRKFIEYHSTIMNVVSSLKGFPTPKTEQDRIKQAEQDARDSVVDLLTSISSVKVKYKL